MREREWARNLAEALKVRLAAGRPSLEISDRRRLPYTSEILSYYGDEPRARNTVRYETDVLISERDHEKLWTPRVVIEVKLGSVSTHDAITYSQKAATHKTVHPYLRYGILLGNSKHYTLPGRLFRHGAHFDFMASLTGLRLDESDLSKLVRLIRAEARASQLLERIMFDTRRRGRAAYTMLRKPLLLR